ncbi:hypothetical protein WJX74_003028 [Apatococcus lobatus]|uniref:Expansin-like EG45 domain-containing protein n=1 Tax=Apatococcus lobatus TaxID=904363 RepID=A0AAW1RSA3_9CHLO
MPAKGPLNFIGPTSSIALAAVLALATLVCSVAGQLSTSIDGTAVSIGSAQDVNKATVPVGPLADGSCGYGRRQLQQWPFLNVTAISANNSLAMGLPKLGCGICLQVTCTDEASCRPRPSPIVVQVIDTCYECLEDELQLHAAALAQLTPSSQPAPQLPLGITFQQAECQPPSTMAVSLTKYTMEANGNAAIQLSMEQVAGSNALSSIELQAQGQDSEGFMEMLNPFGAAWQLDNVTMPPYDLRITSQDGQQVTAVGAITFPATSRFPTDVQFRTANRFGQGVVQVAAAPGSSKEAAASPPTLHQPWVAAEVNRTIKTALAISLAIYTKRIKRTRLTFNGRDSSPIRTMARGSRSVD